MWDWQYLQQVWLLYVTGVIPSFPRKYKQLAKLKVIPLRLGTPCQGLYIELGQRKKQAKIEAENWKNHNYLWNIVSNLANSIRSSPLHWKKNKLKRFADNLFLKIKTVSIHYC